MYIKRVLYQIVEVTLLKHQRNYYFFVPYDQVLPKKWFTSTNQADVPGKWNYCYCENNFDVSMSI